MIKFALHRNNVLPYHDTLSREGMTYSPTLKVAPLCVHDAAQVWAVQCHLSSLNMSL